MTLAYISPMTIPSRSADSIQIMKACASLAAEGERVKLHIPYRKAQNHTVRDVYEYYNCENNFNIYWQRIFILPEKFAIILIALRIAFSRVDYVISRSIPAAFICALLGKKTFVEIHEPLDRSKGLSILSKLLVSLPSLKGIITNCDALRVHTLKTFPALQSKITAIQNGAKIFESVKAVTLSPTENTHIGYTGQLYKGKGVEVVSALAPRFPDIYFHIIGGLPDDIEHWQNELKEQDNVVFHGFMEPALLPGYLAAFDIVLAPYQKIIHGFNAKNNLAAWTSPMKVFDYMSAGKAIICSDLPFAHEVLDDGQNAILCPPDDIDAWAMAIKALVNDAEQAKAMGAAAKEKVLREYTWKKRAQKLLNFIGAKIR